MYKIALFIRWIPCWFGQHYWQYWGRTHCGFCGTIEPKAWSEI